jgi:hypothetical protein
MKYLVQTSNPAVTFHVALFCSKLSAKFKFVPVPTKCTDVPAAEPKESEQSTKLQELEQKLT